MKYYVNVIDGEGTFWYKDPEMRIFHRENGPAMEFTSGTEEWWLNGKHMTEEEFNNRMTPVELTVADIEKLLNKKVKIVK